MTSFVLKGGGWYATDDARQNGKSESTGEAGSGGSDSKEASASGTGDKSASNTPDASKSSTSESTKSSSDKSGATKSAA